MKCMLIGIVMLLLSCGTKINGPVLKEKGNKLVFRVILKDTANLIEVIGFHTQVVYPGETPYNMLRGRMFLKKENDFNSFDTIYLDTVSVFDPVYPGCIWQMEMNPMNNTHLLDIGRYIFNDTIHSTTEDTITFIWPDDTIAGGYIQ